MLDSTSGTVASATDAELARAIASRPPGAAHEEEAELYRRFARRVRLYGLKHLRDLSAADDLSQQVMLAVIERLRADEVRNADEIASFILGTARLMAGSLQRTARRREALLMQVAGTTPLTELPVEAPDLDALERCLQALRERDRTLLILTFYAETPAPKIAQTLGCEPGAVRVARHRALLRMRDCMMSGAAR